MGGEDGRAGVNGAEIKNGKEKEEKREAKVEIQLLFRAGAGGGGRVSLLHSLYSTVTKFYPLNKSNE